MSYTSDIWLYPLQDWWRTVNEMSGFISTGQMGNFIFRPVLVPMAYKLHEYYGGMYTKENSRFMKESTLVK